MMVGSDLQINGPAAGERPADGGIGWNGRDGATNLLRRRPALLQRRELAAVASRLWYDSSGWAIPPVARAFVEIVRENADRGQHGDVLDVEPAGDGSPSGAARRSGRAAAGPAKLRFRLQRSVACSDFESSPNSQFGRKSWPRSSSCASVLRRSYGCCARTTIAPSCAPWPRSAEGWRSSSSSAAPSSRPAVSPGGGCCGLSPRRRCV